MNEKPRPDYLARLRVVEGFLRHQLDQVGRWIVEEERKVAAAEARREPLPPPDWLIEQSLNGRAPVYVHRGDCWNAGKRRRGVTQEQAVRALAEEAVPACPHCRPDTELGILD
ncbi:DUF6233 domain-containing protein [Streptomyces sp. IBSBF 2950]|uniref:DUF6233 domain-containing protein n=1 Tax=Streptomyces sp. IBSBF 2950 TaxID=2903528 RepID=UPI002FDC0F6B